MLSFDEAIGVGRHLSAIQRKMLLDLENWPDNDATDYNRQELIWKELIFRTSWSPQYRWTDRGLAVVMALQMRALSDVDLKAMFQSAQGACQIAVAALREIEDRHLDL